MEAGGSSAFVIRHSSFVIRHSSLPISVNLTTGAATSLRLIGGSMTFNTVDLAAFVVPEPGTYAMFVLGGAALSGLVVRRRRMA